MIIKDKDYKYKELKKVCYKKEPFKTNDISHASFVEDTNNTQIKITDEASFESLYLDKKYVSELDNTKFKPQVESDSSPHIPYNMPIP